MSKSFTTAVGIARSIGTGTVFSRAGRPVTADDFAAAYNRGLGEWQISSAALAAELSARFAHQPIVLEWSDYTIAVTNLFRAAAVQPSANERHSVVSALQRYVSTHAHGPHGLSPAWQVLRTTNSRFAKSQRFRETYRSLTDWMLGRGDQLMEEMLTLTPSV